jgi:hypothetical protein
MSSLYERDACLIVCCTLLQRTKWAIFVSVPIWFGYGFARNPDNLEWVKEVVRRCCFKKGAGTAA